MASSHKENFVEEVKLPIQIIDVVQDQQQGTSSIVHSEFTSEEDLREFFATTKDGGYSSRFISICQHTSYSPLQLTRGMMDTICSAHTLGTSLSEVASCFYDRWPVDAESTLCIPYTEVSSGQRTDISYTIRYPEFKDDIKEWAHRQSGVYHQFDKDTKQNLFILFSPAPNSKGYIALKDHLTTGQGEADTDYLWMHGVLTSTYLTSWRGYIAEEELIFLRRFLRKPLSDYIDEDLYEGHRTLTSLVSLVVRLTKALAVLEADESVSQGLAKLSASPFSSTFDPNRTTRESFNAFNNHIRRCDTYSRTVSCLQQRAQSIAQLLADTLASRHEGRLAKEQNEYVIKLNKKAVFITKITLVYLPASFSATFFGMNFFSLDEAKNRIVGTPMVWIYIISTGLLTVATFLCYSWLQYDGGLLQRYRVFKRRLSRRGRDSSVSMRILPV